MLNEYFNSIIEKTNYLNSIVEQYIPDFHLFCILEYSPEG